MESWSGCRDSVDRHSGHFEDKLYLPSIVAGECDIVAQDLRDVNDWVRMLEPAVTLCKSHCDLDICRQSVPVTASGFLPSVDGDLVRGGAPPILPDATDKR